MIKGQGLSLAEGSRKFGIPLWQLYALSRDKKNGHPITAKTEDKITTTEDPVISNAQEQEEPEEKGVEPEVLSESPLPEDLQQLILEYRKKDPKIGFKRIKDQLKRDHLVVVGRKQAWMLTKIEPISLIETEPDFAH